MRHRLTLYAAAARHTRALAAIPGRIADPGRAAELAESCRALAETATRLGALEVAAPADPTSADLAALLTGLASLSSDPRPPRPTPTKAPATS